MIGGKLQDEGYCVLKNLISYTWIEKIKSALPRVFESHLKIRDKTGSDFVGRGFAFHLPLSDPLFLDFLQNLLDIGFIQLLRDEFFNDSLILNSFTALNNCPGQVTFSSNPHRDVRFYTSNIPVMLNMLIILDEFTELNGPTLVLPHSHKEEKKPTDKEFFDKAVKILGDSGDVLLFNSNVWHAASTNKTDKGRQALALTFTIPSLKQLLDYPRGLGYERANDFDEELGQLLGYSARVPANLEEWYQPQEKRLYKKQQY